MRLRVGVLVLKSFRKRTTYVVACVTIIRSMTRDDAADWYDSHEWHHNPYRGFENE